MKSNKSNKKNRELRRQLEILKAQIKTDESTKMNKPKAYSLEPQAVSNNSPNPPESKRGITFANELQDKYLKKDILKTLTLSAVAFSLILVIWAQTF